MADLEFRQLLRKYCATGVLEDGAEMFHRGQRLGFSLNDYKHIGVDWMTIVSNLWQLNECFLSLDEDAAYRRYLHENTSYGPYSDRKMLFAHSSGSEDWHPSWPLDHVSVYAGSLAESSHGKLQTWGSVMRLAFWGADDTGIEMDIRGWAGCNETAEDTAIHVFEEVVRDLPSVISRRTLLNKGFVRA